VRTVVRTLAAAVAFTVLLVGVWLFRPGTERTVRDEPPIARPSRSAPADARRPRARPAPEDPPPEVVAEGTPAPSEQMARFARGLRWLADHQQADGSWHDPATTGIALLAFLGAGETQQSGSFRETVRRGVQSLVARQRADGRLSGDDALRPARDHAVAALALVEAYGITGARGLKSAARSSIDYALASRTPGSGWHSDGSLDIEATGWTALLLACANLSDLSDHRDVLDDAAAAASTLVDPATGLIRTAPPHLSVPAATAFTAMTREFAQSAARDEEAIRNSVEAIAAAAPAPGVGPDPLGHYVATRVARRLGRDRLMSWRLALESAVHAHCIAEPGRDDYGSWEPGSSPATPAERVWATALNLCCIEWYAFGGYRHALSAGTR
jgi:hypothetical protein